MNVSRLTTYRPVVLDTSSLPLSVIKLSQAGFRYKGEGCLVICDGCRKVWEMKAFIGDCARMLEPGRRRFHSDGCPFIDLDPNNNGGDDSTSTARLPQNSKANKGRHGIETNHAIHKPISSSVRRHELQKTSELQLSSDNFALHDATVSCTNLPQAIVNGHHIGNRGIISYQESQSNGDQYSVSLTETVQDASRDTHKVTSPILKVSTTPSYPTFTSYKKRLDSFTNWQHHHIHRPDLLAERGFFYAGYSDCVRCFQCGLGLRSWKPGDDVIEQHLKHRPNCPYLQAHRATGCGDVSNVSQGKDRENIKVKRDIKVKTEDVKSVTLLEIENRHIREQLTCKVCHKEPVKDLFLPCGELYACTECSKLLTHCPSCHKQILATVTTYLC